MFLCSAAAYVSLSNEPAPISCSSVFTASSENVARQMIHRNFSSKLFEKVETVHHSLPVPAVHGDLSVQVCKMPLPGEAATPGSASPGSASRCIRLAVCFRRPPTFRRPASRLLSTFCHRIQAMPYHRLRCGFPGTAPKARLRSFARSRWC